MHSFERKRPIWTSENNFCTILRRNRNLIVPWLIIKKTILATHSNSWAIKGIKMIFVNPCIKLPIVYAYYPTYDWPHRTKFILLIWNHNNSTILRHILNWAYLFAISNRVNHTWIQPLDNFLLYHFLHRWINSPLILNARITVYLKFDFVWANSRWNPNDIRMDHSISFLNFGKTNTKASTFQPTKLFAIITNKVLLAPKNA